MSRGQSGAPGWSKYLATASAQLMPVVQGENYHRASNNCWGFRANWRPVSKSVSSVEVDNLEAITKQCRKLDDLLPSPSSTSRCWALHSTCRPAHTPQLSSDLFQASPENGASTDMGCPPPYRVPLADPYFMAVSLQPTPDIMTN
jgi:hypothetical protein